MALSKDRDVCMKYGDLREMPVVASEVIYKGALVKIDANGFMAPCSSEAGAVFAGIAYESVDNSAGIDGAVSGRVLRDDKSHQLPGSGFTQADLGKKVYAADDETVVLVDSGDLQEVGVIDEYFSATLVGVTLTAKGQSK